MFVSVSANYVGICELHRRGPDTMASACLVESTIRFRSNSAVLSNSPGQWPGKSVTKRSYRSLEAVEHSLSKPPDWHACTATYVACCTSTYIMPLALILLNIPFSPELTFFTTNFYTLLPWHSHLLRQLYHSASHLLIRRLSTTKCTVCPFVVFNKCWSIRLSMNGEPCPRGCSTGEGRNLVICVDGTSNKFGQNVRFFIFISCENPNAMESRTPISWNFTANLSRTNGN